MIERGPRRPTPAPWRILPLVASLLSLLAGPAAAQAQDAEARIRISGSSTVRNWSCQVQAPVDVDPSRDVPEGPALPEGVHSAVVRVPVGGIECPEEEMHDHLREAMRADEFPEIVYRMEAYTVEEGADPAQGPADVTLSGSLTILETTERVEMEATLEEVSGGLRVQGRTRLDMTDYGVEPPTVMLGMLEVGPVVTLDFSAVVPGRLP